MGDLKRLDLQTVADGALPELFERELNAVLMNIDDVNTDPKKKRRITIEITGGKAFGKSRNRHRQVLLADRR